MRLAFWQFQPPDWIFRHDKRLVFLLHLPRFSARRIAITPRTAVTAGMSAKGPAGHALEGFTEDCLMSDCLQKSQLCERDRRWTEQDLAKAGSSSSHPWDQGARGSSLQQPGEGSPGMDRGPEGAGGTSAPQSLSSPTLEPPAHVSDGLSTTGSQQLDSLSDAGV